MKTRAVCVLLTCLGAVFATARAEEPPVDPWTDPAWESALYGLARNAALGVTTVDQLLNALSGKVVSTREAKVEFDPYGRAQRIVIASAQRGEPASKRSFSYVYGPDGTLLRIHEDGHQIPALERRFDAANRLTEESRRIGGVIQRTRITRDRAGRETARTVDEGDDTAPVTELRTYYPNGALARISQRRGRTYSKVIDFDRSERPVRIRVHELLDRRETRIDYPTPVVATHVTHAFAATREGIGTYERNTMYRVRDPQEFERVEAPAQPLIVRWEERGGTRTETRVQFDEKGRPRVEQDIDATGAVACSTETRYHDAGPPLSIRTRLERPDAPCRLQAGELEISVEADYRGNWTSQSIEAVRPDGKRQRLSVQTRTIEYAQ